MNRSENLKWGRRKTACEVPVSPSARVWTGNPRCVEQPAPGRKDTRTSTLAARLAGFVSSGRVPACVPCSPPPGCLFPHAVTPLFVPSRCVRGNAGGRFVTGAQQKADLALCQPRAYVLFCFSGIGEGTQRALSYLPKQTFLFCS